MGWQTAAEGTSFWDLKQTIADMELPKGSKMKVVMDLKLPLGWAFDAAGAELAFKPFVPDGMKLIDVYGEGSKGIVEMEADPVWLVAALLFIEAHWVAIAIAGLVLASIILFITVLVLSVTTGIPIWVWLVGGGALLYLLLRKAAPIAAKAYIARRIR